MSAGAFTSFMVACAAVRPVKRLTGIANIFQQALGAASASSNTTAAAHRRSPGARKLDD